MNDNFGRQLHDKATRNELLTVEEETKLSRWYAQQDQEEDALLASSPNPLVLDTLWNDVVNALLRLKLAAPQVRAQAEENIALQQAIATTIRSLRATP
ncbi:MAG: hypothetical protein ACRYFS_03085 [Janthinobacterium lividum]